MGPLDAILAGSFGRSDSIEAGVLCVSGLNKQNAGWRYGCWLCLCAESSFGRELPCHNEGSHKFESLHVPAGRAVSHKEAPPPFDFAREAEPNGDNPALGRFGKRGAARLPLGQARHQLAMTVQRGASSRSGSLDSKFSRGDLGKTSPSLPHTTPQSHAGNHVTSTREQRRVIMPPFYSCHHSCTVPARYTAPHAPKTLS